MPDAPAPELAAPTLAGPALRTDEVEPFGLRDAAASCGARSDSVRTARGRLSGKRMLVTGGSRGIGAAIVRVAAAEGAVVAVNYHRGAEAAAALIDAVNAASIPAGGGAFAAAADVRDRRAVERLVDDIERTHGPIDVLVNNAGVVHDALLLTMTDEAWAEVLAVNLDGTRNCTRAVTRHMLGRHRGKVINMSSVAADIGGRGHANYAAAKGAINAFTRSMAVELAPKGISVCAVAPGVVRTEMSARVRRLAGEQILARIPMGRYAEPEEVARVVVFLASDECSYLTGEVIRVSGGLGA
jgi:3-oxoacyl-[acyl-carrier protein] reductase